MNRIKHRDLCTTKLIISIAMRFKVSTGCKPCNHTHVVPSTIKGASGPSSIYNEGEEGDRHNIIHVIVTFLILSV